jgi:hypothetical protein
MTIRSPLRLSLVAVSVLTAWALPASAAAATAAAAAPAGSPQAVWRVSPDYCAEIDGTYAPDARVFVTDAKGRFLIDLPSLSTGVLVNTKSKTAVRISRWSMKYDGGDGACRLSDPVPSDAPTFEMSEDGPDLRLRIDTSEVRLLKSSKCHSTVTPYWTGASVTDDSSARRCLHREERPLRDTPGCTKGAFLKNSCEVPVIAVVRTTQHLFSGTLPETSSVVVPPGAEHSLGCVWSTGAMAPSDFDLLAAAFLPKPTGTGNRGTSPP